MLSVMQLNNGEVHNIYDLKDIKDLVDKEVYDFILENTVEINEDYEDKEEIIIELKNTIDNLEFEKYELEEIVNRTYNKLDDVLSDGIEEMKLEQLVKHIKECMNILA